ncbi:MAG: ATPase, T2SS/T4P/T4SS family, partial [Dermabacter sp.]|nr:ATPase, T2SS/T4P/T4SS family [Dermabacter sp.]
MLGAVDPRERIIIVEDSTELRPAHPHVVHLQARHANAEGMGEISLATLIRQCLRMRPDRIIVGECRGADIRELLQALNTGHEGGCGTLHANTAADVPARLEALGALAGLDPLALASQALSAITVVLHMHRPREGRALSTISLLQRGRDGRLECVPAVSFGTRERRFPAFDALEGRLGHGGAR